MNECGRATAIEMLATVKTSAMVPSVLDLRQMKSMSIAPRLDVQSVHPADRPFMRSAKSPQAVAASRSVNSGGGCCDARPFAKKSPSPMRNSGVRGVLIYCSDYKCSHLVTMSDDRWPDDMRLSDLEPRFVCSACEKRGAVEAALAFIAVGAHDGETRALAHMPRSPQPDFRLSTFGNRSTCGRIVPRDPFFVTGAGEICGR